MGPPFQPALPIVIPASATINFYLLWSIGSYGWPETTRFLTIILLLSTQWYIKLLACISCGKEYIQSREKKNFNKPTHSRGYTYGVV